jgi:hypothetical protein
MNPNRYCGYCHLLEQEQTNLVEAMKILPNMKDYERVEFLGPFADKVVTLSGHEKAINEALPKLREICNNCPACIMAALRQKEIPVPAATDFNFTKECESIWSEYNAHKYEEDRQKEYSYYYEGAF